MTDFVADFSLEQPEDFKAILEINASPSKVSELENDLSYQTLDEVNAIVQNTSDTINARIDEEVEALEAEIEQATINVQGSGLIEATKEGQTVTLESKTFVFEQGIASNI